MWSEGTGFCVCPGVGSSLCSHIVVLLILVAMWHETAPFFLKKISKLCPTHHLLIHPAAREIQLSWAEKTLFLSRDGSCDPSFRRRNPFDEKAKCTYQYASTPQKKRGRKSSHTTEVRVDYKTTSWSKILEKLDQPPEVEGAASHETNPGKN